MRQFQNSVGLTPPKRYFHIQRFQSVLDQIVSGEQIRWVNVALKNGYYDQSHLIHEFRESTGVTPPEYRPVAPDRKNHMLPG
ncbi:helix-turn-helix domain-containing protein [Gimesia maris]|uniref:helix-turn-helix domain-containing protein n=1 Tax=Gimesia maris TaxID=122 RepID=UPI0012BA32CE